MRNELEGKMPILVADYKLRCSDAVTVMTLIMIKWIDFFLRF